MKDSPRVDDLAVARGSGCRHPVAVEMVLVVAVGVVVVLLVLVVDGGNMPTEALRFPPRSAPVSPMRRMVTNHGLCHRLLPFWSLSES